MLQKTLSLFLVLLLTLCLFAGCSGQGAGTETTLPQGSTAAGTTVPAPESEAATEAPAPESEAATEASAPESTARPDPVETREPETERPTDAELPPDPTPAVPAADGVTPMLFHVTGDGDREMYLFGTIHAGDERMGAAMDLVAPYVDGCDALAVEFDIVAYEDDYEAQLRDMSQFVYTDGTKVDDHMPPELFERASALLQEAKLMPSLMKSYNLAMWSQLVEQAALMTRSDLDFSNGMDRRLIHYCYDKQIEVRDVESSEFQYGLLLSFSDELNVLMIEHVLDHLDSYGEDLSKLFELWLKGSYEDLRAYIEQEDEGDYTEEELALVEDYNDRMLTQRNLGMRDRALEWLNAGDKVFFAVGAAHLIGEGGLVELLQAEGLTVEQVSYR